MGSAGAIVLTAKVQDADKAKAQIEEIRRTEARLAAETARTGQVQAAAAASVAVAYMKLNERQRELQQQSVHTKGDVLELGKNLSVLGVAAVAAHEHVGTLSLVMRGVSLLGGPVGFVAGLVGLGIAAKSAADFLDYLKDVAVPAAGQAEAAISSLRIVTEKTGGDVEKTTKHVEGLENALTSMTGAAQATRTFQSMNLSLDRQRELVDAMRDGIVAMGGDVNTQLPLMALAIKRQEGELLDNMGVVSTVEQMYKTYAATIGTTADKLTQAQREEAVMQGVLRETAKFAGSAEAALNTYQGRVNALATEKRKLAEDMGRLVMPFATFGVMVETAGVKVERRLLDPLKELREYLLDMAGKTWTIAVTGKVRTEAHGAADEASQALLKKLQERNKQLREAKQKALEEGGYGPANTKETNEHYNRVAEETRRANEKARAEAIRTANQAAADQKRLAEELRRELATIGKTGRDLELAQEKLWYDERVRLAHGNAKLLEDLKRAHNLRLREIDKKYPPDVQSGINSAARGLQFSMGQIGSLRGPSTFAGTMGLGRLALGPERNVVSALKDPLDWSASGGQVIPDAVLQEVKIEWIDTLKPAIAEAARDGLSSGLRSAIDGDFGGITSALGSSVKSAVANGLTDAIMGNASTLAELAPAIAAAIAVPASIAAVAATQKHLAGRQSIDFGPNITSADLPNKAALSDPNMVGLLKNVGEVDSSLADLMTGIDSSADALLSLSDRFGDLERQLVGVADDFKQVKDARAGASGAYRDYMVSTGQATKESFMQGDLKDALNFTIGDADGATLFDASTLTLDKLTSIDPELLKPGNNNGGAIAQALGVPDVANSPWLETALTEAIKLAFQIKTSDVDSKRALPGSSPQTPSYTVVTNVKDFRDVFPASAAYRPTGPGTARRDGPPLGGRGASGGRSV